MTREEAITILEVSKHMATSGRKYNQAIDMAIEALRAEPKTGEWIKATGMMPPEFHGHHCCSECGNFANMEPPFGNREDLGRFCPNCGTRMVNNET